MTDENPRKAAPPWRVGAAARPRPRYAHHIPVRVTGVERERILTLARASGMSASRFIARTLVDGHMPPSVPDRAVLEALRVQLERAGIGVCQLARWLREAPFGEEALREAREATRSLRDLSQALRRRLE